MLHRHNRTFLSTNTTQVSGHSSQRFRIRHLIRRSTSLTTFHSSRHTTTRKGILYMCNRFTSRRFTRANSSHHSHTSTISITTTRSSSFLRKANIGRRIGAFTHHRLTFSVLTVTNVVFHFIHRLHHAGRKYTS